MSNWLARKRWSPYLVGAGIGVVSWVTFGLMHRALDASTAYVRVVGLVEALFSADRVMEHPYFRRYFGFGEPVIEWQMMLVGGILVGAYSSAWLSKSYKREFVPALWKWRFGGRRGLRNAAAFVGGALVLFGARLAGGGPLGQGVSGTLQLSVSGWVFLAVVVLAGMSAAFILFGGKGRDHV